MRRLALAALAACALALPVRADGPRQVLALVTSADPQVQGMAFVLLGQMRQQGMRVEVMLCGEAAHLARREPPGPPSPALRPSGATPAQMLANLVRADARIRQVERADLRVDAGPPEMARRMLAEHTRVLPF